MVLMRLRRIMMQTDQYLRRLDLSFIVLGKYAVPLLMGARVQRTEYLRSAKFEIVEIQ